MKIEKFEDILAWQKSKDLIALIYKLFKDNKDFTFNTQIKRAGISVMNNIAEGFERKGNKEFKWFLFVAKGSCAEVRSMLYLAIELGFISEVDFKRAYNVSLEISKILSGLIKTL